mmetsp:Transcript_37528/g.67357  ORF Transcript_37528/g.67357 Transcript_37528/m.67357 type:complete len:376 (-) Transcript_37528:15-1142(-)
MAQGPRVAVVGGGIIGAASAHYLAKQGFRPVVIEQCGVACHSSGKAAGFLASDWLDGSPVASLARKSFQLHKDLADEFGPDKIGYRTMNCIQCVSGTSFLKGSNSSLSWLDRTDGRLRIMGGPDTIAQVHPRKLTEALIDSALAQGGSLLIDKVVGVEVVENEEGLKQVKSLATQQGGQITCEAVVLAMGPWTQDAQDWFPGTGLPSNTVSHKYTSITWDASADNTAVFLDSAHHVEIYPRSDEVYASGCPEMVLPIPSDPRDISPGFAQSRMVQAEAARFSSIIEAAKVKQVQACYLPGSDDNLPVIGKIPTVDNAFVACGHTCWGILNAPGTGKAIADLVAKGVTAVVDLRPFEPKQGALASLARLIASKTRT